MRLSVVIPTYNRFEILRRCLDALTKQSLSNNEFEVVAVNDGSTDGTEAFLRDFSACARVDFRYFNQINAGQGAARNLGVEASRGEFILFLGDDIIASPQLLEKHLQFHKTNTGENEALLGFTTWDPSQKITPLMRFMERGRGAFGRFGGHQFAYDLLEGKRQADYRFFYTSNISLKTTLLQKETFDESFRGYGWEDIDLGLRLTELHRLKLYYNKEACAFHDHPMSLPDFRRRMRGVGRGSRRMQEKWPQKGFIPSFNKRFFFQIVSNPLMLQLWKLVYRDMYYYALSKKYFLAGVNEGYNKDI